MSAQYRHILQPSTLSYTLQYANLTLTFLSWKLSQRLLLSLETFTPILLLLRLVVFELGTHTGQTDGQQNLYYGLLRESDNKRMLYHMMTNILWCCDVILVSGERRDGTLPTEARAGGARFSRSARRTDLRRTRTVYHTAVCCPGQFAHLSVSGVYISTVGFIKPVLTSVIDAKIARNSVIDTFALNGFVP